MRGLLAHPGIAPADAILLEPLARGLLLVHAVVGFTALFSCTHHAVYAVLSALGPKRAPQLLLFGWIAPLALGIQVLFGLLLYPTYRVRIADERFEREGLGWLSELFDAKEHAVALSLAFVLGASLVGRSFARERTLTKRDQATVARGVATLSVLGAAFVWTAALIGLYITARQPVGLP